MYKIGCHNFFLSYIKMSEETYYQKHRDVILRKAKDYYKNYKERLKGNARDKYKVKVYLIKTENVEVIDIIICLKKRNKN